MTGAPLAPAAATVLTEPDQLLDVAPGKRRLFRIPVARRASGEDLSVAVHVARGAAGDGPVLGLVAAVHGDAVHGSHIIRLAMERLDLDTLSEPSSPSPSPTRSRSKPEPARPARAGTPT